MTPFAGINRVTSAFGYREYYNNGRLVKENHRGQDIVPTAYPGEPLPESAWTVREVTGGVVLRVSYDASRGNYVDVETAPGVFERYQHMKSIAVRRGDTVVQGQTVGAAGNTGNSTGRHLHFGVYRGGSAEANAVNPAPWSDLPNKVGTYPGNNTLDTAPGVSPQLYIVTVGPVSQGDRERVEALAAEMGVPASAQAV